MTNSASKNVSETHVINTGESASSISGSLYSGSGEEIGSGVIASDIPPGGRAIFSAADLEQTLGAETWRGPAMLELQSEQTFNLMTKLTSPVASSATRTVSAKTMSIISKGLTRQT